MLACEKTSQAVLQWHQPVVLLPVPNINSSNTRLLSTALKWQRIFCLVCEPWEQSCFKCSENAVASCIGTGKWSWEAAVCLSSSEMRRMLSRDVYNILRGKKPVKEKSDPFLTALQKRKDKKLIFTCVAYERFSFSPRQFVSLKTKKTINNAGQNFATKSNRFSSSYHVTFNKQTGTKKLRKLSPSVLFLAFWRGIKANFKIYI